jgi:hypothetical protein
MGLAWNQSFTSWPVRRYLLFITLLKVRDHELFGNNWDAALVVLPVRLWGMLIGISSETLLEVVLVVIVFAPFLGRVNHGICWPSRILGVCTGWYFTPMVHFVSETGPTWNDLLTNVWWRNLQVLTLTRLPLFCLIWFDIGHHQKVDVRVLETLLNVTPSFVKKSMCSVAYCHFLEVFHVYFSRFVLWTNIIMLTLIQISECLVVQILYSGLVLVLLGRCYDACAWWLILFSSPLLGALTRPANYFLKVHT